MLEEGKLYITNEDLYLHNDTKGYDCITTFVDIFLFLGRETESGKYPRYWKKILYKGKVCYFYSLSPETNEYIKNWEEAKFTEVG